MGNMNTQKAILKMTGIDFGPLRSPQRNMSKDQEIELGTALHKLGLNITDEYVRHDFEYIRHEPPTMVKEYFQKHREEYYNAPHEDGPLFLPAYFGH